jgi:hypothetical protein
MADRKIIALFIGIGVLNFLVSAIYISMSGLPGGEVGMAPLLIAILSIFAIVISSVVYWVTKIWTDNLTPVRSVFVYQAVYLLVLYFGLGSPVTGMGEELLFESSFWIYLLSFLVTLVLIVVLWRRERRGGA